MGRLGERRPWFVAAAGALALLSGCVSPGDDETGAVADQDGTNSPYIPIAVAADEAAIDGIVLSDAFQPIEGATIELREAARTARSDRLGRFAFLGLEPGPYSLVASRDGFSSAFTRVETEAGRVASVQLALTPVASDSPYFAPPIELRGYIGCGLGFSPVNPASCTNGAAEDANHRVQFAVPVAANLTGVMFEMVWTARGEFAGRNLQARLLEPANAGFEVAGPSPLVVPMEAANETFTSVAQNLSFDVRVAAGTNPVQGGDWSDAGGVVLEQGFRVYLTFFYRGHPIPEGFTGMPEV